MRLYQRSKLIKQMSTSDLTTFRELLDSPIAGHIYEVNQFTTFKTPIKKIITIVLNTVALRLLIESGEELRAREKGATKTP